MMKWLFFFSLMAQVGFSQRIKIDSLKRELIRLEIQPNGFTKDTLRVQTLKAIMRGYADVNIDSSLHYNTQLTELCQKPALQKELTHAYQFRGYLYQVRGEYHDSIRFHYKALALAEKLKQYNRMSRAFGDLAHAYTRLKEFAKATQLCEKGLAILRAHPDPTIQLPILNVFGAIYREQRKFNKALTVNQTMYELAKREHIDWYEAQGLHTVGWDYMDLGELPKSLDYYQKALVITRKIGSTDLEESVLLHVAEVYRRQKKWTKSIAYCNQAKQTAVRLKNGSIILEADEKLYHIFKEMGRSDLALNAYEAFVSLRDSLAKEKNQQRIETLRAQYDNVQTNNAYQKQKVELLEQQNQNQRLAQIRNGLLIGLTAILLAVSLLVWNNRRLQAKNREIDRQRTLLEITQKELADSNKNLETRVEERTAELLKTNRDLVEANEAIKAALFKGQTIERRRVALELHDNLSSLLSAVNMSIQAINPQNLSVAEQSVYRNVRHLIQNAYAEVRNISHNILPAGLEKDGLAATLTTLIDRLNESLPLQFVLTIRGLEKRLPVEIEFNMYSIVFELINNAIKHAKAIRVTITLVRTATGVNLSVADDGVGLGQQTTQRGVGLQNVQARLDSLGGTMTTVLPIEKGTRMDIKIPIDIVHVDGNATTN